LYIHGGGWIWGSTTSYRGFVSRLAFLSGTRVLSIDYRLAPEHQFPAGLDDCTAAFDALVSEGVHPEKIIVCGDSAGGNLTLALLVALRDRGSPLPAAAACISPVTDLTASGESHQSRAAVDPLFGDHQSNFVVSIYAGSERLDNPLVSPLFADLHGLPPLLLHVGDHEVLLSDSIRFGEKARAAGVDATVVVWPKMFHVFHLFWSLMPEARTATREVVAFIRTHLGV
jgi:acetyl esterase/lipase